MDSPWRPMPAPNQTARSLAAPWSPSTTPATTFACGHRIKLLHRFRSQMSALDHPSSPLFVSKDLCKRIDTLHGICANRGGKYTPIHDIEIFGAPHVEIAAHYAVARVVTHLICCLHMSRGENRAVGNKLKILFHLLCLIDIRENYCIECLRLWLVENILAGWQI